MADLCLLLASGARVARGDFARGELTAFASDDETRGDGLATLVDRAADLGGPLPKHVWVLAEDVFVHEVKLRAQLVDGLADVELARLLGYEASTVSGLAAAEAVLAHAASPASAPERGFTVVQLARADYDALSARIAARGARLAGVAHPSGLPRALDENAPADWRRVESWPDLLVDVESRAGRVVVRLRRTDPTRGARTLAGEAPVTETLSIGGVAAPTAAPLARAFDLATEDDLRTWLSSFGRVLTGEPGIVLALRPAPRPASPRRRALYAATGAVLATAACALHYRGLVRERDELVAEIARTRAPAQRLATARTELSALRVEVEALETQAATMRAALARAGWSADAPARVLDAAAGGRPAGATVDALSVGWSGVRVRGVALRPDLVDTFSRAVASALEPEGFVAAPANRKRLTLASGADVYEYVLEVWPRAGGPAAAAANGEVRR